MAVMCLQPLYENYQSSMAHTAPNTGPAALRSLQSDPANTMSGVADYVLAVFAPILVVCLYITTMLKLPLGQQQRHCLSVQCPDGPWIIQLAVLHGCYSAVEFAACSKNRQVCWLSTPCSMPVPTGNNWAHCSPLLTAPSPAVASHLP